MGSEKRDSFHISYRRLVAWLESPVLSRLSESKARNYWLPVLRSCTSNFLPMYWWIAWDLVVGSEVWMHLRMNGILPFLALLFLLNHQQAACCSLLKDRPKSCVLALNGAGVLDWDRRGVYLPSSYPDCASTVHKLTFSPVSSEVTAQVFSLHPLAEGSRKASTPAMQSGTCLSCMWAHKQKMSMRLLCTPGFVKSRQTFLEEEISAVLFPEISQLGVARVSESSLPLSTHTHTQIVKWMGRMDEQGGNQRG